MNELQQNKTTNNKKRIVLAGGKVNTLDLFLNQLKQGFLELGYEIYEFDLSEGQKKLNQFLEYIKENPILAMIAFDTSFFGAKYSTGKNIWEVLGIPCINILVDHPCRFHNEIMLDTPSTGIVLCIDRNHMNYVNRFYPNISFNGFLPHGGTSLSSTHKPISERRIDVMYAGSLFKVPKEFTFSEFKFPAKQIIEHMIAHPEDTFEAAVEKQLRQAGVILTDEKLRMFNSQVVGLEDFANSYYREKILGSIAKAGISMEIYGNGWPECDWINLPNVYYGGMIEPEEILLKMEDTKIVLNTMHWFKDGSHERVFNAMMCGAVAVSETSRYLEEVLPNDTWVSFDLSQESLSELPKRIQDLLNDEAAMQKIASAGHDLAIAKHSWKARARELHEDLLERL